MLYAIVGEFGSGKTLYEVLVACSAEREILGNFTLRLDNYTKIDPIDLKEIGFNKLVLIDEIYLWLESRVSSSFINRYVTYILLQCRHRTIDVYGTLQLFSSVDIRFRATVHRIIKCRRIDNGNNDTDLWDFRYDIMNTYTGKIRKFILKYQDAIKYFALYDTYEIMESYDSEGLNLEILKKNPKKLYKRLGEIALEIKSNLDNITHDSVAIELLRLGYDIRYEGLVYSRLQRLS